MSKFPFGGHDPREKAIDRRADPGPLLAEIAQCVLEGLPLRPELARWFHRKIECGLVKVQRGRGTKRKDSVDKKWAALGAIHELTAAGQPVESAIKAAQEQLNLGSSRETIYQWRAEQVAATVAMRDDLHEQYVSFAREQLHSLGSEGVTGAAAIARLAVSTDILTILPTQTVDVLAAEAAAELGVSSDRPAKTIRRDPQ